MTVEKILNYALPLTSEINNCRYKKQRWQQRRDILKGMIEAYKNGEIVNFEPMKLSVDIDELMKKLNN
ncbi:MAG: hypothetical protein ABJA71_08100 [Ginsengibacter sp.]